jgi:hypothetical protein
LACEQGRKPVALRFTAGQRADSPQFIAAIDIWLRPLARMTS